MLVKKDKDLVCSMQLGPMIDCIMMLLMYFIIAGRIESDEKYLGMMMPGSGSAKETLPVEITVGIMENDQVTFNGSPMDSPSDKELKSLSANLKKCIDMFGEKQPVVIHPQPKVRQQRIADVLDACAMGKVKNLSFQANE